MVKGIGTLALCALMGWATMAAHAEERQVTFSAKNHELDNNDNFSPDGKLLCYDTRETVGPGIDNGQTIEVVEIGTGKETVLYQPEVSVTGERPAPGIGAASFCPAAAKVAFIHGPPVATLPERGPYGKPNRTGMEVQASADALAAGAGFSHSWLDHRDIATDRDTLPGAHRGGTHRHEYSRECNRIGFTYDDFLLPRYGRTIGYMEPHAEAPGDATHYFALLVRVTPADEAQPGDFITALGDSWVDAQGRMRAFIGTVRGARGDAQSLFVADIPDSVDITTADAGGPDRFPAPPEGVVIRRLTHGYAAGIVRGAPDGTRIAYFGHDSEGHSQVFLIPADGSDRSDDPAKRPVQVTAFEHGTEAGLRWHPGGKSIVCQSDGGVAAVCADPADERFGETVWLTPHGDGKERYAAVVSPDGALVAYNLAVPAADAGGNRLTNYAGLDFSQIFTVPFPDTDGDGVAEAG